MRPMVLILLCACTSGDDDGTCDPETHICDTAAWVEEERAEQQLDPIDGTWLDILRRPGCVNGTRWTFTARVGGHGHPENLANVWISGDDAFSEQHVLDVAVSSDSGQLHELQVKPAEGDTDLVCGVHDVQPVLTVAVRVYDEDGELADCGLLSTEDDFEAAMERVQTGQATATTAVTRPEELEGCARWTLPSQ